MESIPTNLEFNQSQTTQTPKEKTTKSSGITVLFAALFILFSLATVAFLYYQNQQLKAMLASYQISQATSTPKATPNPTANWQTYTNKEIGLNFKHPEGLFSTNVDEDLPKLRNQYFKYCEKNGECGGTSWPDKVISFRDDDGSTILSLAIFKNPSLEGFPLVKENTAYTLLNGCFDAILIDAQACKQNLITEEVFNQILLSFKFIESPTPTPPTQSCTLEAKSCPDGSYVGRTGPNCEFAACP